jgi:hypothetical protein
VARYNKFWVASIVPVAAVIWPFISDGFQTADVGPVVVAVLGALGVYIFPNQPAADEKTGYAG